MSARCLVRRESASGGVAAAARCCVVGDGSASSTIYVMSDEIHQCAAALANMLPRESFSKVDYCLRARAREAWRFCTCRQLQETDSALLAAISYPAFAIEVWFGSAINGSNALRKRKMLQNTLVFALAMSISKIKRLLSYS